MTVTRRIGPAVGPAVAAALLVLTAAPAAADVEAGRAVAVAWCQRCHVIGDRNRMGGIDSTPSFPLMARKLESYEERLRSFHLRRPHAAIEFKIRPAEIEDLILFIRSLAAE